MFSVYVSLVAMIQWNYKQIVLCILELDLVLIVFLDCYCLLLPKYIGKFDDKSIVLVWIYLPSAIVQIAVSLMLNHTLAKLTEINQSFSLSL